MWNITFQLYMSAADFKLTDNNDVQPMKSIGLFPQYSTNEGINGF